MSVVLQHDRLVHVHKDGETQSEQSLCPECRGTVSKIIYDVESFDSFRVASFSNGNASLSEIQRLLRSLGISGNSGNSRPEQLDDDAYVREREIERQRRTTYAELHHVDTATPTMRVLFHATNTQKPYLKKSVQGFIEQDLRIIFDDIYEDWMVAFVVSAFQDAFHRETLGESPYEVLKSSLIQILEEKTIPFIQEVFQFAQSGLSLAAYHELNSSPETAEQPIPSFL